MRKRWLMCVLLGTLGWGQAAPTAAPAPTQKPPAPPQDTAATVPPTAAVITINGVCSAAPKAAPATGTAAKSATAAKTSAAAKASPADCKTVITKAEFEKLANNLAPNPGGVTPQMKRQLSTLLPQWIAMSNVAKKKGLDKTPQFEDRVKVLRMNILSQELRQQIQDDAGKISPEDIDKYYKEHADTFETFNLERLYIPRTRQAEPEPKLEDQKNSKPTEEELKARQEEQKTKAEEGEKAMTELAESLRTRAAAGEDFAKLQKEAFTAAGMKIESPSVNVNGVRRNAFPPSQVSVFDLKPGEVSPVINDAGGHYVYKLSSKNEMPMEQAQNEIRGKLQGDRMREAMDKLTNSYKIETNEAYFGPANSGPGPMRGPAPPMTPRPQPQGAPPAQPPAAQPN